MTLQLDSSTLQRSHASGFGVSSPRVGITLEELAAAAGVSKATVSRVINQRGNVSPETTRHVLEAMARKRFPAPTPKPPRSPAAELPARPLHQTAPQALLVPEITADLYVSLLRGFEAASQKQNRQTIVCNTNNNVLKQADDLLQLMHSSIGGVAIVPIASEPTPIAHIAVLQALRIPVVLLHRDVEGVNAPLIALPLKKIGARAAEELLERGHRRIAVFTTSDRSTSSALQLEGMSSVLRKHELQLPEAFIFSCAGAIPLSMKILEDSVAQCVERILALPGAERPTAIYVPSSVIAQVLYLTLINRGLKVGTDISILAFGASERVGPINSRLSSIVVDEFQVGQMAAAILDEARVASANDILHERLIKYADLSFAAGESLGPG